VDDGSASVIANSEALAIDASGRVFASWAVENGAGGIDVRVARSDDGGASFGPWVSGNDGALDPLVAMSRRPWIATDGARVAIAFDDQDDHGAYTVVADADDLGFSAPAVSGQTLGSFVDFARPAFGPDGDLWVAYQAYPTTGARMFVGKESAGFAAEVASEDSPGVPCECCPLDLAFDATGAAVLAYRNNDANQRDLWVARASAPADAFDHWVQATTTEQELDVCPMEGPRLAGTSTLWMTWSTQGPVDPGATVIASSADGGLSWGPATEVTAWSRGADPSVAERDGELFVTAVTGPGSSELAISADGGGSWSGQGPVDAPSGTLGEPQLASGGDRVALIGTTAAGEVWVEVLR
jgi:hypothetical protein